MSCTYIFIYLLRHTLVSGCCQGVFCPYTSWSCLKFCIPLACWYCVTFSGIMVYVRWLKLYDSLQTAFWEAVWLVPVHSSLHKRQLVRQRDCQLCSDQIDAVKQSTFKVSRSKNRLQVLKICLSIITDVRKHVWGRLEIILSLCTI